MASKIQIKRSTGSTLAGSNNLYPGELAYTEGLETVSIGSAAYKTITAGNFVVGTTYTIVTVGDEANWYGFGGPSAAEIGNIFTCNSGSQSGVNGTAGAHNIAAAEHIIGGQAYTDMIIPETASGPASIILKEDTDNAGEHGVTLTVPASLTGDVTLTLPGALGAANTILTTAADGVLSWDDTLVVDTVTASGAVAFNGGLTMDTDKFTVADTSGNTAIAGTLDVTGDTGVGAITATGLASLEGGINVDDAFTVADTDGNIATSGTLGVTGISTLGVINATGLASLDGGIDVDGSFTVNGTTGDVLISGNLEVTGETTSIETADVVVKDKTMVLGVAGGMEEATYQQSGTTVTVTSTAHGFLGNTEFVYISGAAEPGTDIVDGVYVVTRINDNSFTFASGGAGDTVGSDTAIFHSSDNVTNATGTGSGVVVPNGSATMASIIYNGTSNDWDISENIDLASGKGIKIAGTSILSAATALPVTYGGTGLAAATQGSVLVANTANTISALDGGGSVDGVLIYNKTADTISWTAIDLSTAQVTGTLGVSAGGTGKTSFTDGGVLLGGGATAVATLDTGFTGTNSGYASDTAVTGVGSASGVGFTATVTETGGVLQSITITDGGSLFVIDEVITLTGVTSENATATVTVATLTDGSIRQMAVLADGEIIVGDGTSIPVAESGATARTSLGVAIGSDVQAWDTQLDDIAALAPTENNIMVGDGSNWTLETPSAARTSLGIAIGTDVQAYSDGLESISGLTEKAGSVIYTTGDDAYAALDAGTAGQVLLSNGASAPAWSDIDGGSY